MNLSKILKILFIFAVIYVPVSAANVKSSFSLRPGMCLDFCANSIRGLGQYDRTTLTNNCSRYLSTSVASIVVTTTSTATITQFQNNGDHNPSQPMPTIQVQETKTTWTGRDGLLTIAPTAVPNKPFRWPACWPRKSGEAKFTTQFSSVCACQGVTPETTSVPAVTTTAVEPFTTTVALFKLKALFKNGTRTYLEPKKDQNHIPYGTNLPVGMLWVLSSDANEEGLFLFGLTPQKNLIFESRGLKGWRPAALGIGSVNGELVGFLQEEDAKMVDGIAPRYYIDVESRPGEGHELMREEMGAGAGQMGFFAVGIEGRELMWFGGDNSVKDLPGGHEPIRIFVEAAL